MEMEFDWDPAKAASNLEKHNIDFLDAATVFDDPMRIEVDSTKPEFGEERTKKGHRHDARWPDGVSGLHRAEWQASDYFGKKGTKI